MAGETDQATQLIEQGADVNAAFGCALVAAASRAQLEVIERLLDHGADPNHRASGDLTVYFGGSTPLQSAIQSRDARAVELLLERGAEARVDYEAFQIVINFGDVAMAELLLRYGADPNVPPPSDSPIFARDGNGPVLISPRDLRPDRIDRTAQRYDCELSSAGSDPLLHWALFGYGVGKPEDKVEIARLLLDSGGDPDVRTINGVTPLMESARFHNHAVITMLLEAGAEVGATDRCGRSAGDYAHIFGDVNPSAPVVVRTFELLRAGAPEAPE
jgi:ankyrin repeat protein